MLRRYALHSVLPAAVLFAATAALVPQGGPQGPAGKLQGAIGVVDLDAVIDGYPGAERRNTEFLDLQEQARKELQALEDRIRELEGQRERFDEGTDEYAIASKNLQVVRYEADQTAQLWDSRLQRQRLQLATELFDEVQRGVAAFAEARGLEMVFREPRLSSNPQLRQRAQQRLEMIYHDQALDVTAACRQFLKAWHEDGD